MARGIELRLHDENGVARANLTDIQALWYDAAQPSALTRPVGKTAGATTDAEGDLLLDLEDVTGLRIGSDGFLQLYKLDATDHQDSLVFAGKLTVGTVTGGTRLALPALWSRNPRWLPLTGLPTTGENKLVALHAVFDAPGNFCAFKLTCEDDSAYTVDWGDGSPPEDVSSAVAAEHSYDYDDLDADTEVAPGPGYPGYRQALVTAVPKVAGKAFTALDMNLRHTAASAVVYTAGWLDVYLNAPSMTALAVIHSATLLVRHGLMERFQAPELGAVTSWASAFRGCVLLQSVELLDTSSGTDFSNMFLNCRSLQRVPLLDTSAGVNFQAMFSGCSSLVAAPLLDTGAGTNFQGMFYGCNSLLAAPLLDTGAGTDFTSMFYNCTSLVFVPLLDTSSGQDFTGMFQNCTVLNQLPLLDVSAGTAFSNMLTNTPALQRGALSGTVSDINYQNSVLSGESLDEIYSNLGTPATTKTITVTGNYGTASHTPSIATAKNWTVVG